MTHKNWFLVHSSIADLGALAGYPVKIAHMNFGYPAWSVLCTSEQLDELFEKNKTVFAAEPALVEGV